MGRDSQSAEQDGSSLLHNARGLSWKMESLGPQTDDPLSWVHVDAGVS